MKRFLTLPITITLGAAALAASASISSAQSYRSYYYNESTSPSYSGNQPPATEAPRWTADTKPAQPPSEIIGAQVVDFKGDPVGQVAGIAGDHVIVRFASYLGMEHATGAFPWQQLEPAYGNNALLATSLSKGQMEGLPPTAG